MTRTRTHESEEMESPENGAAYWFVRENTASLTRQECAARDEWLARAAANCEAYERARALWGGLDGLAAHEQMRDLRRAALAARPGARPLLAHWWGAAAALAGIAVAAYLALGLQFDQQQTAQAIEEDTHGQLKTAVGERSTTTLKDGSTVTLNTASEVRVRFTDTARVVELARGQAYFSVAKDEQHPFVVVAGGQRITALGTAFDVRVESHRVQVLLVEGKVAVNPIAAPDNKIELQPGERYTSGDARTGSVAQANVAMATSWRNGRIVFADASLADALAEVNRYRDRPVTVSDTAIGRLKVSGTYRISEVDRFPEALAAYYPLQAAVDTSGVTVLSWRDGRAPRAPR